MDDAEAFRKRRAEAKAAERAAHEQAIKRERSSLRWALVIFAVGAGLWLLSYADWLPAGLATILAGSEDRANQRFLWLLIAGMGIAIATLSYLDLRALRLGTERARKQANAAKAVAKWLLIAGGVLAIGAFLLLIGFFIGEWLTGRLARFPFLLVNYLAHILVIMVTLLALFWIEGRAKTAGLIFAAIALGALLAADIAVGLFIMWDWMQVTQDRQLPLWMAFLAAIPNVLVAPFLLWGIVSAVRRLRALAAEPPTIEHDAEGQRRQNVNACLQPNSLLKESREFLQQGGVAGVVGIESGVVSGVFNLESSGVEALDRRPRHDKCYHEGQFLAAAK